MLALDQIEHLDAVHARALQPDVEDHQLRAARAHGGKRAVAVAGDARVS